jgi:hypothetical protein
LKRSNSSAWRRLLGAVFVFGLLTSCAGGIKPETQAALTQLGALVQKGCEAGALTQDECRLGEESLTRLGLDLEEASKYVVAREVWVSVSPFVIRVGEALLTLIGV